MKLLSITLISESVYFHSLFPLFNCLALFQKSVMSGREASCLLYAPLSLLALFAFLLVLLELCKIVRVFQFRELLKQLSAVILAVDSG